MFVLRIDQIVNIQGSHSIDIQAYSRCLFYNTVVDHMQIYIRICVMLCVPANSNSQHKCNLVFALFAHSLSGRMSEPWANKIVFSAHAITCLDLSSCVFICLNII